MRFSLLTPVVALALLFAAFAIAQETSIDELIQAIGDADRAASINAMDELTKRGLDAEKAIPALDKALGSDDEEIVWHAARSLAALGPAAGEAVPSLTAALSSPSNQVQAYAAYALGRIGSAAAPAAEALLDRIFDDDLQVRRVALKAMLAIDPPREKIRPVLVKLLKEGDPALVSSVMQTYAEEGKEIVPRLCDAMEDDDICYWACIILGEIGPDAAEAVPHLGKLIGHKDPDVALQALVTLGEIGKASESAVPEILDALKNSKYDAVKFAAAFALGRIQVKSDDILSATLAVAKSDDPLLHLVGVWALARMDPEREGVLDYAAGEIVDALASDNPQLRSLAAKSLLELDVPKDIVRPKLVALLQNASPDVANQVLDALASQGPEAVPSIAAALKKPELRHYAAQILIRMGPKGAAAVPALVDAMKATPGDTEDDLEFCREGKFALAMMGPAAAEAIPFLIEALAAEDREVRGMACYALGKMGPAAAEAAPRLQEQLEQLDGKDKVAVIWALLEIVPGEVQYMTTAVPILTDALENDEAIVRGEAARSLGEIGELAKSAVPKLKGLQNDPSPAVRAAAVQAIEKIGE